MKKWDVEATDFHGTRNAALIWAARKAHEGVGKILLGQDGVNPHKQEMYR